MARPYPRDLYGTRIYRIWAGMKGRCSNPKISYYARYGGRGIKVCERWQDFYNFYEDMIETYSNGLQLDRIDNHGNYEASNCRWATPKEQANNTRNIDRARRYAFNSQLKTIREWSEAMGIKRTTLDMRLRQYNWPIEQALGVASYR